MYTKISDPKTGHLHSINSTKGRQIIQGYLSYLTGGSNKKLEKLQKQLKTAQRKVVQIQNKINKYQLGGGEGGSPPGGASPRVGASPVGEHETKQPMEDCPKCAGTGKVTIPGFERCRRCGGSGDAYGYGAYSESAPPIPPCVYCDGTGQVDLTVECSKCLGVGEIKQE